MSETRLLLTPTVLNAMWTQVDAELPNECCGLLAGVIENGVARALERFPLVNELAHPRMYRSDARSMFGAEKRIREKGWVIVAVYHSHPTSAPIPSQSDRENLYSPDVVNLILAPLDRTMRAWWLTADDARETEWSLDS